MERFIHYVFIISLTLLFILISGFLAETVGMISALLISIGIYTSIYTYKRVKNQTKSAPLNYTEGNENDALYEIVHRLVKRTDLEIPVHYMNKEKDLIGKTYGTI